MNHPDFRIFWGPASGQPRIDIEQITIASRKDLLQFISLLQANVDALFPKDAVFSVFMIEHNRKPMLIVANVSRVEAEQIKESAEKAGSVAEIRKQS